MDLMTARLCRDLAAEIGPLHVEAALKAEQLEQTEAEAKAAYDAAYNEAMEARKTAAELHQRERRSQAKAEAQSTHLKAAEKSRQLHQQLIAAEAQAKQARAKERRIGAILEAVTNYESDAAGTLAALLEDEK
jgi:hypothetical protein